jgi:hypothetical protein
MGQPDIETFKTDYARAQGIVETRIENVKPEDREGFLNTLREVHQSLRETANALVGDMPKIESEGKVEEGDLNPFQLAFRDAILETRRADEWASREWPSDTKWLNLNDTWVGIGQRGIKEEHINESHREHQENAYVRQIIADNREANQVAYNYSPREAIETYDKLIPANAPLKCLYSQLDAGIPAKFKPDRINGRDVLGTPGTRLNCLIHALIKVGDPKLKWETIIKAAHPIRKMLVEERLAADNDMLDLNSEAGQRVIMELTKVGRLEPNRDLLIYQLDTRRMRMRCTEVRARTETNSDTPPYALFLEDEWHFDAMSEPKEG